MSPTEPPGAMLPDGTGRWAFQIVLGLIGTASVASTISRGGSYTAVGRAATVVLVGATLLAFGAAYLEARALDDKSYEGADA